MENKSPIVEGIDPSQLNNERINKLYGQSQSIPLGNSTPPRSVSFNTSWSLMRTMVLFFGVVMVITVVAMSFFVYQSNEAAQRRAFFITGDGTFLAKSAFGDLHSREIEVRGHVRLFMSLMYAFDERNFKSNIERALHLIGDDGALIHQAYKERKMHEELIKSNGVVTIQIDSMWASMNTHPYKARVFCRQTYETSIQRIESVLWADMNLKNAASRSEDNLSGLIIENFNIVKNELISL